jgi:hypothetical protein
LNAAYNIGMGVKNKNWGQALGGIFNIPGVSQALGGLGSMVGNATGLPSSISNALISGGLGAISSGLSGGNPLIGALGGGLGSYGGSLAGGLSTNPIISGGLSSLANNSIKSLVSGGDLDPRTMALSILGGGLKKI